MKPDEKLALIGAYAHAISIAERELVQRIQRGVVRLAHLKDQTEVIEDNIRKILELTDEKVSFRNPM